MNNNLSLKTQLYSPTGMNGFGNDPPIFPQESPSSVLADVNQQLNSMENNMVPNSSGLGVDDLPDFLDEIDLKEINDLIYSHTPNALMDNYTVTSPLSANQIRNDSGPFRGQYRKIEELLINGSEIDKSAIDRMWLQWNDPLFDITSRKTFAGVIEQIRWDQLDPTNEMSRLNWNLTTAMIGELKSEVDNFVTQYNGPYERLYPLKRWQEKLGDPSCYSTLVGLILRILNEERRIIECAQDPRYQSQNNMLDVKKQEANNYLERIQFLSENLTKDERISQNVAMEIENLNSCVQELQVLVQGRLRYLDQYNLRGATPAELKTFEGIKQKRNMAWQNEKRILANTHWELSNDIQRLITQVLDEEVREWQRNQACMNNGMSLTHYCTLPMLQDWCKRLARLVSGNIQQITKLQFIEEQIGPDNRASNNSSEASSLQYINELINRYSMMLHQLVEKGLVVETQPPQVLMKDKRFQSKLRHLVCDGLDIHQVPFDVEVWLISEEQANHVLKEGTHSKFKEGGTIVNNKSRSEYLPNSGIVSVSMRNMCLKMGQRGPQQQAGMVAEVKVAMIFRANITVRCSPTQTITVKAQTISLPIVVISHGKQEADAQATIFWDNAFASDTRNLFEVEKSVSWQRMLDALDCRWKKECRDSNGAVGLTDTSREYLTMKLFKQRCITPAMQILWDKFNHDKMVMGGGAEPKKELFTFWSWFFKAMELCSSSYVRKYWNLGLIHGFLSKQACNKMLLESKQPGVFLFRFSETKFGALSISCTRIINGQLQVCHLQPDIAKDFKVRSLPDMLCDLDDLHTLYPDKLKDEVFGPYYSNAVPPPTFSEDGYIPKEFVVVVKNPRTGHGSRSFDHSSSIASPDVSSCLTDKDEGMEDDSS
ncbi:signal transducer and activator of transcription 5A-like [Styela clava]|uniref:signal transducer and activator of transcription 5A-like n=1 Tax=Styela clava TaxID=7725 RepID=UPI001939639B|nr:signal transducer and activator of transcription 5A-like [Styela clava]XP_039254168.1 signal transducer and activator of transcription 5A-like [Styela clava]